MITNFSEYVFQVSVYVFTILALFLSTSEEQKTSYDMTL